MHQKKVKRGGYKTETTKQLKKADNIQIENKCQWGHRDGEG